MDVVQRAWETSAHQLDGNLYMMGLINRESRASIVCPPIRSRLLHSLVEPPPATVQLRHDVDRVCSFVRVHQGDDVRVVDLFREGNLMNEALE